MRLVAVAPTVPQSLLGPRLSPTGEETICAKAVSVKMGFEVPSVSQTLESDGHMTKMTSFKKCVLV